MVSTTTTPYESAMTKLKKVAIRGLLALRSMVSFVLPHVVGGGRETRSLP
jgi:hypothetical protein